ncbi:MAG: trehalose-phosphatase [Polyangiales bacterium]
MIRISLLCALAMVARPDAGRDELFAAAVALLAAGFLFRAAMRRGVASAPRDRPAGLPSSEDLSLPREAVMGLKGAAKLHVVLGEDGLFDDLDPGDGAAPDAALLDLVEALNARVGTRVTIVSGRRRSIVERWFRLTGAACYAEHGAWRSGRPWRWERRVEAASAWTARVESALTLIARAQRRSLFEASDDCFTLTCCVDHDAARGRWIEEIRDRVDPLAKAEGAYVEYLRDRVVVRPRTHEKRNAVLDAITARLPGEELLVVGRDRTEHDMLLSIVGHGAAVSVGRGVSSVPWALRDAAAVRRLLGALASP